MAEFNYNNYIKNNPLLQKPVKETLLTESQEVSEDVPSSKTTVSELKAEIKEMILASMNEGEDGHVGGNTDADFEREAAMQMSMREEEEEKPDGMDVFFGADAKDKMKKRREDAVDFLQKHKEKYGLKEDEDEDIELEDEVDIEAEPEMDMEPAAEPEAVGFSPEEEQIQTSLKTALDSALAIGDEKLADQIGNSITFFTRTHVVQ